LRFGLSVLQNRGVKPGGEIAGVAISIACEDYITRELSLVEIWDCLSFG